VSACCAPSSAGWNGCRCKKSGRLSRSHSAARFARSKAHEPSWVGLWVHAALDAAPSRPFGPQHLTRLGPWGL
jgi:hypothetical protein